MLENENHFQKALELVDNELILPEIPVLMRFPFWVPGVNVYFQYSETTRQRTGNIVHVTDKYNAHLLKETTVDCNQEFKSLLKRYFSVEVANTFNYDESLTKMSEAEYCILLNEAFIREGIGANQTFADTFESIRSTSPSGYFRALKVASVLTPQTELYLRPEAIFGQKIESWRATGFTKKIDNITAPIIERKDIELSNILKENGIESILRQLIKLWALEQVKNKIRVLYGENGLEAIFKLDRIGSLIVTKIKHIIHMGPEERKEFTHPVDRYIKKPLDIKSYVLVQHVPLLRQLYGHATMEYGPRQDNESLMNHIFNKVSFHLNFPIIKYTVSKVCEILKKGLEKAKEAIQTKDEAPFCYAYLYFVFFVLGVLSLPFAIILQMAMGISSYPFKRFSRFLKISSNGLANQCITALEIAKDAFLFLIILKPFALSLAYINSLSLALLPNIVQLAAAEFTNGALIFSSLGILYSLFTFSVGGLFFVFVWLGYFQTMTLGGLIFNFENMRSTLSTLLNSRPWLSYFQPLSTIFMIFNVVFSVGMVVGYIINPLRQFIAGKKMDLEDLGRQTLNLNHEYSFRQRLASLLRKRDSNELNDDDNKLLVSLRKCVLDKTQCKILENYIDDLLSIDESGNRGMLMIAKQQLRSQGYFPSKKMTDHLATLVDRPELEELRLPLESSIKLYETLKM